MMKLPNSPWGHILTDLFGMLLSKEYVLVVQCLYSCSPVLEIVTSTSASSIISAMEIIKMNIGIPNKVGTDNGPPFNNQDFANFTKHMGFQYTRVPSYASKGSPSTLSLFLQSHTALHHGIPTSPASIKQPKIQNSTAKFKNQHKPVSTQGSPRKLSTPQKAGKKAMCEDR